MNYSNYMPNELFMLLLLSLSLKSHNILYYYALYLIFNWYYLDNLYLLFIYLELFTMMTYFLIGPSPYLIYFLFFNTLSTFYFIIFIESDYLYIYFLYKLGMFPFNYLLMLFYKYFNYEYLMWINIYPKFFYYYYLSPIYMNPLWIYLSMMIKKLSTIKDIFIILMLFNNLFILYFIDNYKDWLIIYLFHFLSLYFYLISPSYNLSNIFFFLSYIGMPPFLGFYKYLYLFNGGIFMWIYNLYILYLSLKLFLLSLYTNNLSFSLLNLFYLFMPLEGMYLYML